MIFDFTLSLHLQIHRKHFLKPSQIIFLGLDGLWRMSPSVTSYVSPVTPSSLSLAIYCKDENYSAFSDKV